MSGLNYTDISLINSESENKLLYNGKEKDGFTGFYEYGFRDYDAQLGRWHVRDAMAEKYYTTSPYAYVTIY